jgi:hypothetical protein
VANTNWEIERLRYHNTVRTQKPRKQRGVFRADGNPGVVIAFAPIDEQLRIRAALSRLGATILASGPDVQGQFCTIVIPTTNMRGVELIVHATPG